MKSGAIFLFLGFLALWAQLPPASAQVRPGACPIPQGPGTCVEMCQGDDSCPPGWKCCSNGCGHVCMRPITRPRGLAFPPQAWTLLRAMASLPA
nr:WAP four-disulfide core domain protein 18-like isoform X2 [Chelonoidis abingdonii]